MKIHDLLESHSNEDQFTFMINCQNLSNHDGKKILFSSENRMGDKEIKQALKDAVENIKKKDYEKALKDVKKVLSKDKNNYKALIFCGLCLAEQGQNDKAVQAYTRATNQCPDQAEGWKGLAKFYEKQHQADGVNLDEKWKRDYMEVLTKLQGFTLEDLPKYSDTCSKLASLQVRHLFTKVKFTW